MSATLYVVRHCEAAGNIERYFQGHTDGAVSEKGRRQLELLSERFRAVELDAVYSSPLSRAMETALAVNRWLSLPIQTDDRLMEINGGEWEGVPWAEMPERFPEDALKWNMEPHLFHPRGGEAMPEVYARMSAAICDIARANDGRTVAIASHGCAIRNLICWAKGWPIERLKDIQWCDNTAVTVIKVYNGQPRLLLESDVSHLTEGMSTLAGQRWWKEPEKMVYDD